MFGRVEVSYLVIVHTFFLNRACYNFEWEGDEAIYGTGTRMF